MGGTVSPTSGDFEDETIVTLEGTPNQFFEFIEWTGSVQSAENPLSINMDSDKNVTGVFELMDTDEDGVTDDIDLCAETPSEEEVDETGCSDSQKDTDGDGVTDDVDACPETPAGEEVDETGCSDSQKDTDEDGVTDDVDACPGTPAGEEVDENGCSPSQTDSDGDGVNDDLDTCPETPCR